MLRITVVGTLTHDVELKTNDRTGKPFAILRIASDRRYYDKDGNRPTDFISVKVHGRPAERCAKYACKGCRLAASGDLEIITGEDDSVCERPLVKARAIEILTPRRVEKTSEEAVSAADEPLTAEDAG